MTHLGEPICLNERLCKLSSGKGVHVLLLDDYQSDLGTEITRESVKTETTIEELNPKYHELGRKGLFFIKECAIDQMQLFLENRKENESKVFCFP